MPQYVLLINLSDRGVATIDEQANRLTAVEGDLRKQLESLDGEPKVFVWTLGSYDAVAVVELESPGLASGLAVWLSQAHSLRTTTLQGLETKEVRLETARC